MLTLQSFPPFLSHFRPSLASSPTSACSSFLCKNPSCSVLQPCTSCPGPPGPGMASSVWLWLGWAWRVGGGLAASSVVLPPRHLWPEDRPRFPARQSHRLAACVALDIWGQGAAVSDNRDPGQATRAQGPGVHRVAGCAQQLGLGGPKNEVLGKNSCLHVCDKKG